MRKDGAGLFWQDVDHKSVKKVEVLKRHEWVEVIPGYWVEAKILDNPEIDYLEYIYPLAKAYELVKGKNSEKRQAPEPFWLEPDYLPHFEEASNYKYNLFTDEELIEASMEYMLTGKHCELEYDIECYINYFLIAFYNEKREKVIYFEKTPNQELDTFKLKWVLENFKIVSFNGNNYDIYIAALALANATNVAMKTATSEIIEGGERGYNLLRRYKTKKPNVNHIDIMEVAPLSASLKIYGGRVHCKRMQDLPFHHAATLTPEQITIVRWYCINDLLTTRDLKRAIKEPLELREKMSQEYGVDLRSKSDAQIAEAVIGHELEAITGSKYYAPTILPGTTYKYQLPNNLFFQTPLMNSVLQLILNADFVVSEFGSIALPQVLKDLEINIGNSKYKLGIGGLHSTEKTISHMSGKKYKLVDRDVKSYYPEIIRKQRLYPKHIGPVFLDVYSPIIDRRLAAKDAGDKSTANTLKIVINGSFGKFGSMYSLLYAPDLLIQTTISGQLYLLMFIEALELSGIEVVSANTDGVVMKCPVELEGLMLQIVKWWESVTKFETEETPYTILGSRDVNNYIAVKDPSTVKKGDERIKAKGIFAKAGLSKNPQNEICIDAIEAFLLDGVPIEKTIRESKDITKFVNVRTVKGGAVKTYKEYIKPNPNVSQDVKLTTIHEHGYSQFYAEDVWKHKDTQSDLGVIKATVDEMYLKCLTVVNYRNNEFLGKAIRWYYSNTVGGEIIYALSGNKVPNSEGARPLMLLPDEMPTDIDYDWYIAEAEKMLRLCGL